MRVEIRPEMLRWARERARLSPAALGRRFPHLEAWESGAMRPTLKQVEDYAGATHTPVGYLFLPQPPVERVPIPDFRSGAGADAARPSPDLLDTIYLCQQRQAWFLEYARAAGHTPLPFVGSATLESHIEETASHMRAALGFDLDRRRETPTWTEALRHFLGQADELGILVMVSGVVGSNNRRKLHPAEFRGFALTDPVAPLVFVNGADFKAAQMFTLAHELAHVWLGATGVSDVDPSTVPNARVERWCNQVAAELLVPLAAVRAEFNRAAALPEEMQRLARRFKVSALVVLRRIHDAGAISGARFREAYTAEIERLRALPASTGGDFYLTLGARVGRRFARAVVESVLESRAPFTEAFRLLGFRKMDTFRELALNLGMAF